MRVGGELDETADPPRLRTVESLCGLSPADHRTRRRSLEDLVAVAPHQAFRLSAAGETSCRALDALAPIGLGTRGLIASPPKAGKTLLLESIARGILADRPATRVVVFLIDERPEEVTQFRRAVPAEVIASSNDQSPAEHVDLAEKMLAHLERELEAGHDAVVLLDSLTRMVRAFNLSGTGEGHLIEGVLERDTLEIPKRFFQLARQIEGGGSITLLATALIATGSNLDDLIYEEFHHQATTEIVLDRTLADRRLFPALNVHLSGTVREEALVSPERFQANSELRKQLLDLDKAEALERLLVELAT
jgi:transcription termination factor Rho